MPVTNVNISCQGGDRKRAKDWETERKSGKMSGGPLINIQNSTVSGSGTIYGGTTNAGTSNIDMSKKRYYEKEKVLTCILFIQLKISKTNHVVFILGRV